MSRRPPDLPAFELTAPVTAKALPQGPQWVHEIEHDGRRCAALIEHGAVRLLTRSHRDVTRRFHTIAADLLAIRGHDAIIDGEIAAEHDASVVKFENLHRAIEASAYERLVYIASTCSSSTASTCAVGLCSRARTPSGTCCSRSRARVSATASISRAMRASSMPGSANSVPGA
jgi:hypothetical protein